MYMTAVGDWEAAGAQFYSKEHLYDMQWQDINLESKRCEVLDLPICFCKAQNPLGLAGAVRQVYKVLAYARWITCNTLQREGERVNYG